MRFFNEPNIMMMLNSRGRITGVTRLVTYIFLVVALFLTYPVASNATPILNVHLGFATYDPLKKIFSSELYNPRLPNGDPGTLWVPSGTTVVVYVYVDFDREGSANGPLTVSASIFDHDDGLFPIPGIDDRIVGPIIGTPIPSVAMGGQAKESQKLGPLIFYLERADVPGIRNVSSNPTGDIIESGLAVSDFEYEDQFEAQTLEIIAPVTVTESGTLFDSHYTGTSARFYLSVLQPGEFPRLAKPGAIQLPVPEPSSLALFTIGVVVLAGVAWRKRNP